MSTSSISRQIVEFTARGKKYQEQAEANGTGHTAIQRQAIQRQATEEFRSAYKLALLLNNEDGSMDSCAKNYGHALKADGFTKRGDSILQTVQDHMTRNPSRHSTGSITPIHTETVPEISTKSDALSGDFYYNLGCEFNRQKNVEKALENYEHALAEYSKGKCTTRLAQTHVKLANLHLLEKDYAQAQESFFGAAELYQSLEDYDNATHCMLYEADSAVRNLEKGDTDEECEKILEDCCANCQNVENTSLKGRLICGIGSLYLSLEQSRKALACFEACIDKCKNHHDTNPQNHAIALQNAGRILVKFGRYRDAVIYLKQATRLHGKLGNRNVQGQCFCDLGYAQFQLKEYADAKEAYLHSLQAFKDTDDRQCQWQAYEGLAAIASLDEDLEKAQAYYASALCIQGHNKEASERLVGKLQSVLQRKVA